MGEGDVILRSQVHATSWAGKKTKHRLTILTELRRSEFRYSVK